MKILSLVSLLVSISMVVCAPIEFKGSEGSQELNRRFLDTVTGAAGNLLGPRGLIDGLSGDSGAVSAVGTGSAGDSDALLGSSLKGDDDAIGNPNSDIHGGGGLP